MQNILSNQTPPTPFALLGNNNKLSLQASRFPPISRLGVRQVMASPPTIAWSTSTPVGTITSATISGTTLTVVTPGITVLPGMGIAGTGVTANSVIMPYGTNGTSGTGGAGTYALNFSSTVAVAVAMTTTLRLVNSCDNYTDAGGSTGRPSSAPFTYGKARSFAVQGAAGVQRTYIKGTNVSFYQSGTLNPSANTLSAYFTHTGQTLVILMGGYGEAVSFKVDDAYISLTPHSFSNDNNTYYGVIVFPTVARRRIEVFTTGTGFGGVMCGTNDPIAPSELRGPNGVFCMADSYVGGATPFAPTQSWFQVGADIALWDDAVSSACGGSGFVADSSGSASGGKPYIQRLPTDVFPYKPDMLIFEASVNDASQTPTALAAAAGACFALCRQNIPNTLLVCVGPMIPTGNDYVAAGGSQLLAQKANLKAVCAQYNVIFIDMQNMPLPVGYTPSTSSLTSASSAGAKSLSVSAPLKKGATYQFADGSQINVINTTGSTAPFSVTITNSANAQLIGATLTEVGPAILTGNGADPTVGGGSNTYTGIGTADVMRSSDGIHPTIAGQEVYAEAFLTGLLNQLPSN